MWWCNLLCFCARLNVPCIRLTFLWLILCLGNIWKHLRCLEVEKKGFMKLEHGFIGTLAELLPWSWPAGDFKEKQNCRILGDSNLRQHHKPSHAMVQFINFVRNWRVYLALIIVILKNLSSFLVLKNSILERETLILEIENMFSLNLKGENLILERNFQACNSTSSPQLQSFKVSNPLLFFEIVYFMLKFLRFTWILELIDVRESDCCILLLFWLKFWEIWWFMLWFCNFMLFC